MADHGFASARIGYESDSYYFSPRALDCLRSGLPGAEFVDADLLVNWQRLVKSEAEIEMMRGAVQRDHANASRGEVERGRAVLVGMAYLRAAREQQSDDRELAHVARTRARPVVAGPAGLLAAHPH